MTRKTSKPSRKQLLEHLAATYKITKASFEAYGRAVHAYIDAPSIEVRREMEKKLPEAGFKVNLEYSPGSATVEITNIAYFKAPGWNE